MKQINLFEPVETKEIYLASFCLDRKELLNGLRSIKRSMQVAYRDSFLLQFELFVLENSIHLRLFENEYWIETPTSGTCRTTLYYRDVMDAVRACKNKLESRRLG